MNKYVLIVFCGFFAFNSGYTLDRVGMREVRGVAVGATALAHTINLATTEPKKPVLIMLDAARILSDACTCVDLHRGHARAGAYKYAGLWLLIDVVKLCSKLAPDSWYDKIKTYISEQTLKNIDEFGLTDFEESFHDALCDSDGAAVLKNWVLPALEVVGDLSLVSRNGRRAVAVRNTSAFIGLVRSIEEYLCATSTLSRRFFFLLIVGHFVSIRHDINQLGLDWVAGQPVPVTQDGRVEQDVVPQINTNEYFHQNCSFSDVNVARLTPVQRQEQCTICLDAIGESGKRIVRTPCGHFFCHDCLRENFCQNPVANQENMQVIIGDDVVNIPTGINMRNTHNCPNCRADLRRA